MDDIKHKFMHQNYKIKCTWVKIKKSLNSLFIKLIIYLLALLTLYIIIFFFLFYSKKKIKNHLQKKYKRKLAIDTDNDIDNVDPSHDTSQDITYLTEFPANNTNPGKIINNCSGLEFFNGQCSPNKTNNKEDTDYIYHIIDQIEEGKFKEIFNRTIEQETNIIQRDNNITYQISTVTSQYSANLSKVSLEKCESILKDVYSLDKDEKLILLKLEHNIESFKIPIIEYQLFTKDGQKLNLSYCDNIPEKVSIPVNINENEEFIHNPYSRFYQDKCYPYTSEYDTDLTIYDRKNDFNEKFLSLCEKNCIYLGYNNTNKEVNCECKTKIDFPKNTTTEFNLKELLFQFIDIKKYSNIFVITCTKVLFTSEGFKHNFGSNYNIAIFADIIIMGILFVKKGYHSFQVKINDIIDRKFENYKEAVSQNDSNIDINVKELDNQDKNSTSENELNVKPAKFYNDCEMNDLKFSDATKIDDRTFGQIYKSQIKTKNIFIFTFCVKDDYNSTEIKICLFLFWLSLNCTIEALFFNDSTMHKIYEDKGKYNFIYQLGKIFYSICISKVITIIVEYFSLSEDSIAEITRDPKKKSDEIKKDINKLMSCLKIKFIIFFGVMLIFILLFWYFLSSFCAVFKNSQMPLIINIFIGYGISLLLPFLIVLITGSLRFYGLKKAQSEDVKDSKDSGKCLYILSKFYDIIEEVFDQIKDWLC